MPIADEFTNAELLREAVDNHAFEAWERMTFGGVNLTDADATFRHWMGHWREYAPWRGRDVTR